MVLWTLGCLLTSQLIKGWCHVEGEEYVKDFWQNLCCNSSILFA